MKNLVYWQKPSAKNEAKGGLLGMLWGILGVSLLKSLLTGNGTIRAVEGTIRAGQDF